MPLMVAAVAILKGTCEKENSIFETLDLSFGLLCLSFVL
jgi:hypothetical protein